MTGCVRPVTLAFHARGTLPNPDSVHPRHCWLQQAERIGSRSAVRQHRSLHDIPRPVSYSPALYEARGCYNPPHSFGCPAAAAWARCKYVNIDQLTFRASEPALDHDIICPPGLAAHTLGDVQVLQKLLALAAGKLAALVGVLRSPVHQICPQRPVSPPGRIVRPGYHRRFQTTIFLLYQSMIAVRYMWLRRSLM